LLNLQASGAELRSSSGRTDCKYVFPAALAAPLPTTARRFRSSAAFCCPSAAHCTFPRFCSNRSPYWSSSADRTFPRFCGSRSPCRSFLCRLTAGTLFCGARFGAFNSLGDALPNRRNDWPAAGGGFSCESTDDSAHDRADRAGDTADRSAGHGTGCLLRDWWNLNLLG